MIRTTRTVPGPSRSTISLGLLGAVGGLSALLTGLTLAPERASSAPAAPSVTRFQSTAPAPVQGAALAAPDTARAGSVGEPRRTVRVVYPGPVTR
ncbi:hypothetical protein M446_2841 [Methylobacterium sp. 4-46]|uniref:hypothetical protein n=1 Tax=unclassified Methylobacterium TaxID=2615210 RepID=UPI000165C96A|nr:MULTISPECIES: hypothetical protein [Methylobacterium]ACA17266.1 hypothetical protein M446_2841 [Methylobacterium sp. 4-46]WFT82951.1 hypothetical protein QA634_14400 [Methylobacterium nodulans]